jgi:hypothetical protein
MTLIKSTSRRWLAGITVLAGIGILGTSVILNERSTLDEELKAERVQTESLFSGKILLQKEVSGLKRSLDKFKTKTLHQSEDLDELRKQISLKERFLSNGVYTINQLKAELTEINLIKERINGLYVNLLEANALLEKENESLRANLIQTSNEYTQLESEFREKSEAKANYIRIEALHGKRNKQTRKASQTQRVYVSFTWPESMGHLQQGKKLYLVFSSENSKTIQLPKPVGKVMVSLKGEPVEIEPAVITEVQSTRKDRQEIVLELTEKLAKGVYQADIYTDDFLLGGTQIKLD